MKAGSATWQLPPSESVPSNWLLRLARPAAFIVAAAATRVREGVATTGLLGRNEGERRYIKGLRFNLRKAGKKAYFCYTSHVFIRRLLTYLLFDVFCFRIRCFDIAECWLADSRRAECYGVCDVIFLQNCWYYYIFIYTYYLLCLPEWLNINCRHDGSKQNIREVV